MEGTGKNVGKEREDKLADTMRGLPDVVAEDVEIGKRSRSGDSLGGAVAVANLFRNFPRPCVSPSNDSDQNSRLSPACLRLMNKTMMPYNLVEGSAGSQLYPLRYRKDPYLPAINIRNLEIEVSKGSAPGETRRARSDAPEADCCSVGHEEAERFDVFGNGRTKLLQGGQIKAIQAALDGHLFRHSRWSGPGDTSVTRIVMHAIERACKLPGARQGSVQCPISFLPPYTKDQTGEGMLCGREVSSWAE
ncbi:hypothetical protein GE21DRAFT_6600 [Neurospora crassa]|uniref:Uncharacterized protein n=1 Tax=Neurospora crassa (strain ATCC 24698 / 74-OR23-1A / CBS 708.71 / DSM 1257 / FGSC 987) TaxID=367110 RepID=Q7S0W6_NEUCR|nr:hypothetical protein NCU09917 [Neurospora crassa OR74A]EAA28967.1 hypothetical protein NCU09917 [Neurospora crassa OR74A]KHE84914.1 hypothetical protein GE21DRAFT_6600 [Neurospora crassa]|eukprot:XP_958203.1 hypothetical protein NCU09917 [Neurospora crassa OR74A]